MPNRRKSPLKHLHTYVKKNIASRGERPRYVYACTDPDCSTYYMNINLIDGKQARCHYCKQPYIIDKPAFYKRKFAMCNSCRMNKKMGVEFGTETTAPSIRVEDERMSMPPIQSHNSHLKMNDIDEMIAALTGEKK